MQRITDKLTLKTVTGYYNNFSRVWHKPQTQFSADSLLHASWKSTVAFHFTVFPFEKQATMRLRLIQQVLQCRPQLFSSSSSVSMTSEARRALDDGMAVAGVRAHARPSVSFDSGLGWADLGA